MSRRTKKTLTIKENKLRLGGFVLGSEGRGGAAKVIKRVKVALLGDIYKMALLTE